jgi:MFS family permease
VKEAAVGPRLSAIAVAFVANGLGGPSFLPRLPGRQSDLGLSDTGLGAVLVGLAAGALLASPVAGRAVDRLGSRPVVVGAAVALGASLWTAGAAPDPVSLFVALAVVGAADAAMDIAMNANGAAYERARGRSVLHRLHGAWSLGALAAAGLAAAAAAAGVSLTWQLAAVGVVLASVVAATQGGLVHDGAGHRREPPVAEVAPSVTSAGAAPRVAAPATGHGDLASPGDAATPDRGRSGVDPGARAAGGTAAGARRRPRRRRGWTPVARAVALLAAVTVGGAVIEGGTADWSAIRLERLGAGPGAAALGFAAVMAGMLAGRLVGDRLTERFGGAAVLRGGMLLVTAGLGAGALVDEPVVFAVGLVVAGLGTSGLFPLAFSAAATTPGLAPGTGAATVSLAARLGFLGEPLLMGAIAQAVGLRWAFLVVAGVALAVAAAAGRVLASAEPDEAAVDRDDRPGDVGPGP